MPKKKTFEQIAEQDGRYSSRAVKFVYEGLGYTIKKIVGEPGHITGQTLCEGLKNLALEKYGRLALLVLSSWSIKSTRDFGQIVYLLIDNNWMKAQPTDSVDDFNDIYDFKTTLKDQFKF